MRERSRPDARRARRRVGVWAAVLLSPLLASPIAWGAVVTVGVVNVNTASEQELQLLPGVGPVRARAILAERKRRGGFKRVEELADVKGLGASMLEKLRPHVVLSGFTTARQENRSRGRASSRGGG